MKIKLLFFCSVIMLVSCGRKHPARIVNKTDETILITVKLNNSEANNFENTLYDALVLNHKAEPGEEKSAADYLVNLDTITSVALLKFLPNDQIYLGTVRAGGNGRNDYRQWEFTEITCQGNNGFIMQAKGADLMKYIHKNIFSDYSHEFVIE